MAAPTCEVEGWWHAPGELTHYFCDLSGGAWAEFLRPKGSTTSEDIATIRRLWATDIGNGPPNRLDLPRETLIGHGVRLSKPSI